MATFDFEENYVVKEILKREAKKILLQLPDGLKPNSFRISNLLEKETKATIYVSANPCHGGCDLAIKEAEDLGVDLIVHYAHTPFIKNPKIPVIYVNARINIENSFLDIFKKKIFQQKRIGIAATIQYLHLLDSIKKILEPQGYDVVIPPKAGLVEYPGQIIGCEYIHLKQISSNVDCYILIGSKFHSLGASLMLNKPVFSFDPFKEKIEPMDELKNKIIKQRYANITKAKISNKFGILISTKLGQFNHKAALRVRDLLNESKKETVIIVVDEVTPDFLSNFIDIDVFVNTTCPRVAIDDYAKFNRPMLTIKESLVVMDKLTWESLIDNGFF